MFSMHGAPETWFGNQDPNGDPAHCHSSNIKHASRVLPRVQNHFFPDECTVLLPSNFSKVHLIIWSITAEKIVSTHIEVSGSLEI